MKTYKQEYNELMEVTAAIAHSASPKYVTKIAETKEEAKKLGVKVGDSYREFIPQKFVPFS